MCHQRLERRIHHIVRISVPVTLARRVRNASVLQNFTNQGMAVQAVVRADSPDPYPARIVFSGQVVREARAEVSVDVEDVAFAVFARLDDGFVGRQGLADSKAGGTVAVSANDEGTVPDRGATSLHFLDSVYFDCAFSPRTKRLLIRILPLLNHLQNLIRLLLTIHLMLLFPRQHIILLCALPLLHVLVHILLLNIFCCVRLVNIPEFEFGILLLVD
mmetsp:Transcript_16840/g.30491  ORF Transcript_16840/g.30491 Transcript_16840/m.30491 type:complete len:217 (-) Transcript_16840:558-1208(-)